MSRALIFAGQGAQFAGMGKDLVEAYPDCRKLFERADEVLGIDLSKLCFEGPEDELRRSDNCQPAIFVVSAACLCALRALAGSFSYSGVAGLSLGEWTALYVAGALEFEDTVSILRARGHFMQQACEAEDGGMVSIIGLPEDEVRRIAREIGVEVANLNSPGQIVLSGHVDRVKKAAETAQAAGAKKAVILKVAGAFHSSLMESAREKLAEVLESVEIRDPRIPVVSNVTGRPHGSGAQIKKLMLEQVTSSVHWHESIQSLDSLGVDTYIELGPGRVLSGLIRRIDSNAIVCNVQDIKSLKQTVEILGKS